MFFCFSYSLFKSTCMKNFTILIFLATIMISCKEKTETTNLELNYLHDIELPLEDTFHNDVYIMQITEYNNQPLLNIYFRDARFIYQYDMNTLQLTNKTKLNGYPVHSYNQISSDSVIVQYNMAYHPNYYHDNFIQILDTTGQVLQSFQPTNLPLHSSFNTLPKDSLYYSTHFFGETPYFDQTIFCGLRAGNEQAFINLEKQPMGFFINTVTNANKLVYFEQKISRSTSFHFYTFDGKKSIVCSYFMESPFVVLDVQTLEQKQYNASSALDRQVDSLHFSYDKVLHSKKMFFRSYTISNSDKQLLAKGYIILDENFNRIGETVMTGDVKSNFVERDNKYYFFNREKTFKKMGSIVLSVYDLQKTDLTAQAQFDKVKKETNELGSCQGAGAEKGERDISIYFKDVLKLQKDTFIAVIVPFERSCPACYKTALNFYHANMGFLRTRNIYPILVSKNKAKTTAVISEYNLLQDPKLQIDANEEYLKYHNEQFYNPRIVKVEAGKITFDKTFLANEMDDFQIELIKLLEINPL